MLLLILVVVVFRRQRQRQKSNKFASLSAEFTFTDIVGGEPAALTYQTMGSRKSRSESIYTPPLRRSDSGNSYLHPAPIGSYSTLPRDTPPHDPRFGLDEFQSGSALENSIYGSVVHRQSSAAQRRLSSEPRRGSNIYNPDYFDEPSAFRRLASFASIVPEGFIANVTKASAGGGAGEWWDNNNFYDPFEFQSASVEAGDWWSTDYKPATGFDKASTLDVPARGKYPLNFYQGTEAVVGRQQIFIPEEESLAWPEDIPLFEEHWSTEDTALVHTEPLEPETGFPDLHTESRTTPFRDPPNRGRSLSPESRYLDPSPVAPRGSTSSLQQIKRMPKKVTAGYIDVMDE